MKEVDYKHLVFELVMDLKAMPEYMKSINVKDDAYNEKYFEGMLMAYHLVLDKTKSTLEDFDADVEIYGLNDDFVNGILNIKPEEDR